VVWVIHASNECHNNARLAFSCHLQQQLSKLLPLLHWLERRS
jgi:hypothetical protein